MKKIALLTVVVAVAASACAQQPDVLARKYAGYITPQNAKVHLTILAADDMEGRETGKPGAEKAARYLAGEYKALGLLPANKGSYFLDVPLEETSLKADKFMVSGTSLIYGKDYYAQGWAEPKKLNESSIVFVGYGSPAEMTVDVAGKIVLLIGEERPGTNMPQTTSNRRRGVMMSEARQAIMQHLIAKNPALILQVSSLTAANAPRFTQPRVSMSVKKENTDVVPVPPVNFFITPSVANQLLKSTGKTYETLKSAIDESKPQTQVVNVPIVADFGTVHKDITAQDIVAYIPGADPKLKDEVLVFSAHYDHIGLNADGPDKVNNGADDDGSGSVGILEIARAFMRAKKEGHGPKRTILFLGNVGEEKGLLGSEYYAEHPVFPLAKTITDLNIDMIGRVGEEYLNSPDSANFIYPIGSAMLSSTLRKVLENANNTYTHLKLDYKYDDPKDPNRFYYRSDHYNFAKHGVPIIFFFNGVHADYHKPSDEVSKINFPLLAKRAQLVFYIGWDLANRAERPVVDMKSPMVNDR